MSDQNLKTICQAADEGQRLSEEDAILILQAGSDHLPLVFATANALRVRHFGNRVRLCSILNARSGACPEDCKFCAQSALHNAEVEAKKLSSQADMVQAYEEGVELPITHFGVVTSGCQLTDEGVDRVCSAIREGKVSPVHWCASLGCLTKEQLTRLKDAGLKRFHHNLETAKSFFPQVCSTHPYEQRLATVRDAKEVGLEVCCGGLFGLGESLEQRVEFAMTVAAEGIDSIPLNFLVPIPGTPFGDREPMKPLDILKTVAMFRLTNPKAEIKVCAGRMHLRDLQSMIFYAGATGMMIGPLLTIAGRDVEDDLQMLRDLEVEYET